MISAAHHQVGLDSSHERLQVALDTNEDIECY